MDNNIFSNRFRKARLRAGLSQTELAELVGLTNSAISMIERGQRSVSSDALVKIADVLNVSIDYLFARDSTSLKHKNFSERIKAIRKKNSSTLQEMADLIGVTKQTLASWEVGRTEPSDEFIDALAKKLGVSKSYLGKTNKTEEFSLDDLTNEEKFLVYKFLSILRQEPEFIDSLLFDSEQQKDFFNFIETNIEYFKKRI